jgi:plastocyanin
MARVVRGLWILVGVCALLALAVVLGNRLLHTSPAVAGPQSTSVIVDVSLDNFAFSPQFITVTAGSTVRWTNNQVNPFPVTHTTTSDTGLWDSGFLSPGNFFTYTFDSPGVYGYHCTIHGLSGSGMYGTVVVLGMTYLPLVLSSGT